MMSLTAMTPGASTQTSLCKTPGPETALWERRPRRDAAELSTQHPHQRPHRREGAAPTTHSPTGALEWPRCNAALPRMWERRPRRDAAELSTQHPHRRPHRREGAAPTTHRPMCGIRAPHRREGAAPTTHRLVCGIQRPPRREVAAPTNMAMTSATESTRSYL
jgi:hypothetical protein